MKEEFNLSEKINTNAMSIIDGDYVILVRDVKEFIKRLKKELKNQGISEIYNKKLLERINKLAGEKLI